MKKTILKLLSLAVFAAIFALASCGRDDESPDPQDSIQNDTTDIDTTTHIPVGPLTKEQAQTKLKNFDDGATAELQLLTGSNGLEAVTQLMSLIDEDDPFVSTSRLNTDRQAVKEFFIKNARNLKRVFATTRGVSRVKEDGGFNYGDNTGFYEWNSGDGLFVQTGNSETIHILFPSTETGTENNAELEISNYEEVEFGDEEDTWYNPSAIEASLTVDGNEVASLDFAITWSVDEFPMSAEITLVINPFTAEVSFDDSQPGSSSASVSLKRGSETLIDASITANYDGGEKTFENVSTIEGHIQLLDITLQGEVDVAGINNSEEDNIDWDDFVDFKLYAGEAKVGDIVFREEPEGGEGSGVYVEYSNGEEEDLGDVLQDAVDELSDLIEEFESEEEEVIPG